MNNELCFYRRQIGGGSELMNVDFNRKLLCYVRYPIGSLHPFEVPIFSTVRDLKIQIAERFGIDKQFCLILEGTMLVDNQQVPISNTKEYNIMMYLPQGI